LARTFATSDETVPHYESDRGRLQALPIVVGLVYGYTFRIVVYIATASLISRCWLALFRRKARQVPAEFIFVAFNYLLYTLVEYYIKNLVAMPRPAGTCNKGCGMPSAHATLATACFVWLALEGRAPTRLMAPLCFLRWWRLGALAAAIAPSSSYSSPGTPSEALPLLPYSEDTVSPLPHLRWWVLLWAAIYLPVMPSRVLMSDHTPLQVGAGALLGATAGFGMYLATGFLSTLLPSGGHRVPSGQ